MKINSVNVGISPKFGRLNDQPELIYSGSQVQIKNRLTKILKKKNPHDIFRRSYINYLEQNCQYDLLIKPNENPEKLDLYTVNKTNSKEKKFASYHLDKMPQESEFLTFCDKIARDIRIAFATLGLFMGATIMLFTLFSGNTNLQKKPQKTEKSIEFFMKSIKSLQKDTIPLIKK